jgi:hypothetical protein
MALALKRYTANAGDFYRDVLGQALDGGRTISIYTLGRAIYEGQIVELSPVGVHLEWTNGGVPGYREYSQVFIAIEHIVGISVKGVR